MQCKIYIGWCTYRWLSSGTRLWMTDGRIPAGVQVCTGKRRDQPAGSWGSCRIGKREDTRGNTWHAIIAKTDSKATRAWLSRSRSPGHRHCSMYRTRGETSSRYDGSSSATHQAAVREAYCTCGRRPTRLPGRTRQHSLNRVSLHSTIRLTTLQDTSSRRRLSTSRSKAAAGAAQQQYEVR